MLVYADTHATHKHSHVPGNIFSVGCTITCQWLSFLFWGQERLAKIAEALRSHIIFLFWLYLDLCCFFFTGKGIETLPIAPHGITRQWLSNETILTPMHGICQCLCSCSGKNTSTKTEMSVCELACIGICPNALFFIILRILSLQQRYGIGSWWELPAKSSPCSPTNSEKNSPNSLSYGQMIRIERMVRTSSFWMTADMCLSANKHLSLQPSTSKQIAVCPCHCLRMYPDASAFTGDSGDRSSSCQVKKVPQQVSGSSYPTQAVIGFSCPVTNGTHQPILCA